MDWRSELEGQSAVLVRVPDEAYGETATRVAAEIAAAYPRVCIVTLAKPRAALLQSLKKAGVDTKKIFVIDPVTGKGEDAEGARYVSSPSDLTELAIAYAQTLDEFKQQATLVDAVSVLFAYSPMDAVLRFAHTLITKTRLTQTKAIFLAGKDAAKERGVHELYAFLDKVIDAA